MAGSPWPSVSALADPVRRALFDHVRRRHQPVTRDEAADACGVSRNLAAFHLDKLVDTGLLHASYQAPADRPRGRGRAPKVYTAGDEIELLIPARRYELIASVLAAAVAERHTDAQQAALQEAHARGQRIGQSLTRAAGDELARATAVLDELGFEPVAADGDRLILRNCPFHALAAEQTALICGLNHALIDGILDGVRPGAERAEIHARLAPRPDGCCVEVARS